MDCEMVGVGQGNKSALGRVTLIEDARAAMVVYQKNRKAWERRVKDQIKLKQKQNKRKPKRKRAKGDELETDDAEKES